MNSDTDNLFSDIPLAQAMDVTLSREWENGVELCAPFECNRNDKGTAFAGSIASILTLTGWGLLTLKLNECGLHPDIMAVTSTINYIRPAKQTLRAAGEIRDSELTRICNDLKTKQRSRASLSITLHSADTECATARADYALIHSA